LTFVKIYDTLYAEGMTDFDRTLTSFYMQDEQAFYLVNLQGNNQCNSMV